MLSKTLREVNIQTRFMVDKHAWPPEQPKTFTPLLLIQHQGHRNLEQSTAIAELVVRGNINEFASVTDTVSKRPKLDNHQPLQGVLNTNKVTNDVSEILASLQASSDPYFILIEGAPGIGKSLLLKEMAYRWGKQEILQTFKLVLLICLRDPAVQQMSLIDHLLQSFCKRHGRSSEIASACRDYLSENNGKDLALLLDGYDEYPEGLRENGLIADILERKVLPCCGLVVSSRPHASVNLRANATVRVDILGFTEAERQHYIRDSMKYQPPHQTDELMQYLQSHYTISSLCYVPFNIVALVYLYKNGISLPENSAELYNHFICLTICRHLRKHDLSFPDITTLTDFPEPYSKIIQQLTKLSLEALNDDKLIFTHDDIKEACPDITEAIPGAINGFGLLQAVEHFCITQTMTTFNFLHLSIQEYLAAHYIANLPADKELEIIEAKFWNSIHFNMFSIYVAITKGQRPSFKHFLCDGDKSIVISDKFLKGQLRCIQLYWCFHEAGDHDICKTIEQSVTFTNKVINLSGIKLTASDVEYVTVFLTSSSHKELVGLHLDNCYIQDHGLRILHRGLQHCTDITINVLGLDYNGLTIQSSSLLSDITVSCNVKKLRIAGNYTIGEDEQLYSILINRSTMLDMLYMYNTALSSKAAIALFTALKNNNKLKDLYIAINNVTDDASDAITTALERNTCLVQLFMYNNPLTDEVVVNILNALRGNNTLAVLGLPQCSEDISKQISSLQEAINMNRQSQGCQVKLKINYG